jgi:L-malate glycosyltransferase
MKVLFLNYEYPPLGGGAANATAYLLQEYSKIPDLEVDLITSSIDQDYHLDKVGKNIRIHRLPIGKNKNNLHFQSQKDLLIYSWKAFWFSRKLLKEKRFDLSHSFFTVPCGFLSFLLFKSQKLPYIVSLRGADVPGYSDRFVWLYKFITPLVRLIWDRAAAVIANSQGLRDLAKQSNPKNEIGVIMNGIDIDHFSPKYESRRISKRFIITPGASRVTHRKGLDYLIKSIARIAPKYPNIYLKIMGDGNAKAELEILSKALGIDDRVEFLGRIPRENTSPYYQEASVFVMPSLNEGMSNAMLEALSSGLPIIATDTGGTKELVAEGENGFIVKMKDAQDISDKISTLIDDPQLLETMSKNSRLRAHELSWNNVANQYVNLYRSIINE